MPPLAGLHPIPLASARGSLASDVLSIPVPSVRDSRLPSQLDCPHGRASAPRLHSMQPVKVKIADLPRGFTYNFSLCNHDEIQEDLLNVLDPNMTVKQEELQLDFHTCEDAPSPPAGPQQSEGSRRAARAGRLLECVLERAWGCGQWPPLWRSTLSVLQRHCPGYRPPQVGAGPRPGRRGSPAAGSPGSSAAAGGGTPTRVRWQAAAGEASPAPCDESKARELMAVWRSYMNLG
ncbi:unnamed protein product [Bubo scandiacus]